MRNSELKQLINMAYDYGYKIVVLLAGLTDSLRLQTQKRTDAGVIGAISDSIGNQIVYCGFAQTYHALKDYENEIVILDEGISYHGEKRASHLVTRRDSAIKALYKKQEAERTKSKKEEKK